MKTWRHSTRASARQRPSSDADVVAAQAAVAAGREHLPRDVQIAEGDGAAERHGQAVAVGERHDRLPAGARPCPATARVPLSRMVSSADDAGAERERLHRLPHEQPIVVAPARRRGDERARVGAGADRLPERRIDARHAERDSRPPSDSRAAVILRPKQSRVRAADADLRRLRAIDDEAQAVLAGRGCATARSRATDRAPASGRSAGGRRSCCR